jgi:hypothetical protein
LKINEFDLADLPNIVDLNQKWLKLKEPLLNTINSIAPIKKILLKSNMTFPWIDIELLEARNLRDIMYKSNAKTYSEIDHIYFTQAKAKYNSMLKEKMIAYYSNKTAKDFKNSKKFWKFYSTTIKLRSTNKCQNKSSSISNGNEVFNDAETISNMFNIHFTSLASESEVQHHE